MQSGRRGEQEKTGNKVNETIVFESELRGVEWFVNYGNVCEKKLPELLRRYNLKLKKRKPYMMLN